MALVLPVPSQPEEADRCALEDIKEEEAHAQNVAHDEDTSKDAAGPGPRRENADVKEQDRRAEGDFTPIVQQELDV